MLGSGPSVSKLIAIALFISEEVGDGAFEGKGMLAQHASRGRSVSTKSRSDLSVPPVRPEAHAAIGSAEARCIGVKSLVLGYFRRARLWKGLQLSCQYHR